MDLLTDTCEKLIDANFELHVEFLMDTGKYKNEAGGLLDELLEYAIRCFDWGMYVNKLS